MEIANFLVVGKLRVLQIYCVVRGNLSFEFQFEELTLLIYGLFDFQVVKLKFGLAWVWQ